jgi:hypothetical protein
MAEERRAKAWVLAAAAMGALALVASASAADPSGPPVLWAPIPPADSGKPVILGPPPPPQAPPAAENCPPTLPCGSRLLGTVQRNGAVEFQVPAWRW